MVLRFVVSVLLTVVTITVEANELNDHVDVTEFTLSNGVRVSLKPTQFDEDEVLIHGVAPGGYSSVSPSQRVAAELSAAIAWESGMGGLTAIQVSKQLYDLSLELVPNITAFNHGLDGAAHPEHIEELLSFIQRVYTEPRFTPEALQRVLNRTRESIERRQHDPGQCFEDAVKGAIFGQSPTFRALKKEDCDQVDFQTAKDFFFTEFLNTDGLAFIIVGDFDVLTIRPLIDKYLGALPPPQNRKVGKQDIPTFPAGITLCSIDGTQEGESQTRLTFPLTLNIDEASLAQLELTSQVIETRLRQVLIRKKGTSQAIDVGYELPGYPLFDAVWLTLHFSSPDTTTREIIKTILIELESLAKDGPTKEELATAVDLVQRNDEFWEHENSYWLAILTNCYQWRWNPNKMVKQHCTDETTQKQIRELLSNHLNLSQYNIVTESNQAVPK